MSQPPPGQPPYGPPPGYPSYPPAPRAPYDIGGALGWAWHKFTAHWQVFVIGMLPMLVLLIGFYVAYFAIFLSTWVDGMHGETVANSDMLHMYAKIGLLYAGLILLTIPLSVIQANLVRAALMVADGERPTHRVLVTTRRAGRIMVTSFVLMVCTAVGTILCYLPGLAFGAFAFFTIPFLVDQDLKTWAAIKASFSLVREHLGLCLLTVLVIGLVFSAGTVACFIGLAVSVPVGTLAQVYAYRALIQGRVVP